MNWADTDRASSNFLDCSDWKDHYCVCCKELAPLNYICVQPVHIDISPNNPVFAVQQVTKAVCM